MSGGPIAFDSVLELCRNQRRRIVLETLVAEQRSLTLDDLTKAVREHDQQTPRIAASKGVRSEIRRSLYHAHLPKLASAGFIDYDRERQRVELTEQFDQAQPTVSTILDADPSLETPMKL